MSKQSTLRRIEDDIERGNLGTARNRLHGLLATYPADLSLRPRLAEIYWQLRHPGMAGLYWFLVPERTDEMRTTIAAFEHECGGDPWIMLNRLKIRWDPGEMPDGFAKEQIRELIDRCQEKHKRAPTLPAEPGPGKRAEETARFPNTLLALGCALVILLALFLLVMGVVQVASWF